MSHSELNFFPFKVMGQHRDLIVLRIGRQLVLSHLADLPQVPNIGSAHKRYLQNYSLVRGEGSNDGSIGTNAFIRDVKKPGSYPTQTY